MNILKFTSKYINKHIISYNSQYKTKTKNLYYTDYYSFLNFKNKLKSKLKKNNLDSTDQNLEKHNVFDLSDIVKNLKTPLDKIQNEQKLNHKKINEQIPSDFDINSKISEKILYYTIKNNKLDSEVETLKFPQENICFEYEDKEYSSIYKKSISNINITSKYNVYLDMFINLLNLNKQIKTSYEDDNSYSFIYNNSKFLEEKESTLETIEEIESKFIKKYEELIHIYTCIIKVICLVLDNDKEIKNKISSFEDVLNTIIDKMLNLFKNNSNNLNNIEYIVTSFLLLDRLTITKNIVNNYYNEIINILTDKETKENNTIDSQVEITSTINSKSTYKKNKKDSLDTLINNYYLVFLKFLSSYFNYEQGYKINNQPELDNITNDLLLYSNILKKDFANMEKVTTNNNLFELTKLLINFYLLKKNITDKIDKKSVNEQDVNEFINNIVIVKKDLNKFSLLNNKNILDKSINIYMSEQLNLSIRILIELNYILSYNALVNENSTSLIINLLSNMTDTVNFEYITIQAHKVCLYFELCLYKNTYLAINKTKSRTKNLYLDTLMSTANYIHNLEYKNLSKLSHNGSYEEYIIKIREYMCINNNNPNNYKYYCQKTVYDLLAYSFDYESSYRNCFNAAYKSLVLSQKINYLNKNEKEIIRNKCILDNENMLQLYMTNYLSKHIKYSFLFNKGFKKLHTEEEFALLILIMNYLFLKKKNYILSSLLYEKIIEINNQLNYLNNNEYINLLFTGGRIYSFLGDYSRAILNYSEIINLSKHKNSEISEDNLLLARVVLNELTLNNNFELYLSNLFSLSEIILVTNTFDGFYMNLLNKLKSLRILLENENSLLLEKIDNLIGDKLDRIKI